MEKGRQDRWTGLHFSASASHSLSTSSHLPSHIPRLPTLASCLWLLGGVSGPNSDTSANPRCVFSRRFSGVQWQTAINVRLYRKCPIGPPSHASQNARRNSRLAHDSTHEFGQGALSLDSRLSTLDSRLSTLDSQLSTLDSRLSTLDSRLSTLDSQLFPVRIGSVSLV
jgi:hypothetical protein